MRAGSPATETSAIEEREMGLAINCDMGEAYGLYRMGDDAGIMPYISIANVACGFHASDPNVMHKTVKLAKAHNVKVGAHPSLPDLQGFGRREMKISREELANCIIYQVGALKGFLEAEGMKLHHLKPHGSLYGMAARMEHAAHAVADAADVFKVPLMGMINTLHEKIYTERGHKMIAEFYVDLDYNDDGGLIITREHDAKDAKEAAAKAVRADTICVHSDTPNAVELCQSVRAAIKPYLSAA
jgi:UPF0271 protein